MAHKLSEKSLLLLVGAYSQSFPGEVVERLAAADTEQAARLLEALDPKTAVGLLDDASDALAAVLLKRLSDDGFQRIVGRVRHDRMAKLKAMDRGLSQRMQPESTQP